MSKRKKTKGKTTSTNKRILKIVVLAIVFFILVSGTAAGIFLFKTLEAAPAFNPDQLKPVETTYVYDSNGDLYTEFHGEQDRKVIKLEQIPQHVQDAVIAIEDERFWTHPGIDIEAIGRILWKMSTGGRVEGASTITQQLIKNSILTPERTIKRKLQEQWLAIQLERKYTKEEILQMYLNRIFFGHFAYGIETASELYFGKSTQELSIAEGALLAGIIQTPNYYSPYNNMEKAISRRNVVLGQMAKLNLITPEQADTAMEEPIVLGGSPSKDDQPFPQFTWYMKERAKEALIEAGVCETPAQADDLIFTGGLYIHTTLDRDMQRAVEETVLEIMEDVGEEEPDGTMGPQVAAIIIDPATGHVKAAVGDRDITKNGLKRYSQSHVSTGSSIKPVLDYSLAIAEQGYTAGTAIDDAPVSFPGWGSASKPYRPLNYHRNFLGIVPLRTALVRSLNIPAVKTFMSVGIKNAIDFAHKLGINSEINPYPSSALGGSELTLEEMTRAFGVFANKGVLVAEQTKDKKWQNLFVTKITDRNGNVLYEAKPKQQLVMDKASAYILTDVLTGVVDRYANAQNIQRPSAGKTGTSQGSQYTWFIGYTPQYVGGVWVGHDKYNYSPNVSVPQSQRKWLERISGTGSLYPALLWGHMMHNALEAAEVPIADFEKPNNITEPIAISSKTGKLPSSLTPAEFIYEEIFIKGTEPTAIEDIWIEVEICTESHLLATDFCPSDSIVPRVRMVRPTEYDLVDHEGEVLQKPLDHIYEVPNEACNIHGPDSIPEDESPDDEPEDSESEDESTPSPDDDEETGN